MLCKVRHGLVLVCPISLNDIKGRHSLVLVCHISLQAIDTLIQTLKSLLTNDKPLPMPTLTQPPQTLHYKLLHISLPLSFLLVLNNHHFASLHTRPPPSRIQPHPKPYPSVPHPTIWPSHSPPQSSYLPPANYPTSVFSAVRSKDLLGSDMDYTPYHGSFEQEGSYMRVGDWKWKWRSELGLPSLCTRLDLLPSKALEHGARDAVGGVVDLLVGVLDVRGVRSRRKYDDGGGYWRHCCWWLQSMRC